MHKIFGLAGSLLAALAVILGAFGAHALKEKLAIAQLQIFETAVKYQFYHAFALLIVFMLADKYSGKSLTYAGYSFIIGTVFFSGSLYILSFREYLNYQAKWAGPITPLGGLFFILGWIFLFYSILKYNR